MRRIHILTLMLAVAFWAAAAWGSEPANGWRGNGTGLWPDANPPLTWQRVPRGALEGLRATSARPKDHQPGETPLVQKGLIRDWLMIGPFAVADSVANFDDDPLGGEAAVEPTAGTPVGQQVWKAATAPGDDIMVFGTAELPWLDLAKTIGFKPNQLAYACTWIYSPQGGPARIAVQHAHGMKAWLNGREVYREPGRKMVLGSYEALSRYELAHQQVQAGRCDVMLRPGWNRLLVKLSSSNKEDYTEQRLCLRISDPPDVEYESRNIFWMTELRGRSTGTPIIVGDRIFLTAEPDELMCLDKLSGQVLWTAAINYYEALTPAERSARPVLANVEPLIAELRGEKDAARRVLLRAKLRDALAEIDAAHFKMQFDGHFEAHFGIVGFTMATPVSDGERVYVWHGSGVAACYDLAGNRQWITRVETGPLAYGSSPALADGVLACFLNRLYGLDAKTGRVLWEQPRVNRNVGAILAAKFNGESVFITQRGETIRPSDGALLHRPRGDFSGDTGWSPGVVLGDLLYQPKYGVTNLGIFDFSGVKGNSPEPRLLGTIETPPEVSRKADGGWIDRWTAGSPLVHEGLVYQTDIYQTLYVFDLATKKIVYRRELDLAGLTHYNAVAVAASPTLVGQSVLVCDNQGNTLVLAPGREFRQLARNSIATQLERSLPLPAQETLAYAPPIADAGRLYLRGERYLYCVGDK
jgi:outer membrane protein assembly factor BamB